MNPIAFDADATFVERHAMTLFVVLLVVTAATVLTSLDRSLLAIVTDAMSAGVAR